VPTSIEIRLPDILIGTSVGVFLIDKTTDPASIASLFIENYPLFARLWFLCLEPDCMEQYVACLALEQKVAELEGQECQIVRKDEGYFVRFRKYLA
jgi:hypothetical protein